MRETLPGADLFDPAPVKGTTCASTPRQRNIGESCSFVDRGEFRFDAQNYCDLPVYPTCTSYNAEVAAAAEMVNGVQRALDTQLIGGEPVYVDVSKVSAKGLGSRLSALLRGDVS